MAHTHHSLTRSAIECIAVQRTNNKSYRPKEKNRLLWCMVITALTMFLEIFGGIWTNSLALISDAAHMFSDLFALGVSFIAILVAMKQADEARSYGFYRAEIIAALFNGFTLIVTVIWILYDACLRFMHPLPVETGTMLIIATIGLAVNIACAIILKQVCQHDLNIKSAFIHNIFDTFSSVGIIIAGVLIHYTGKFWLDPLASVLIALLILFSSISLIRDAIHILLESTPKRLSQSAIIATVKKEIVEIHNLHHLHIWELTSHMYALTAHVEIDDVTISESEILKIKINTLLKERFGITHTNLQFECKK